MVATSTLTALMRTIVRRQSIVSAVIVLIGAVVGVLAAQTPGLWGAVLGAVMAAILVGTTSLSLWGAVGREPQILLLIVLGSWIVKMVLIIAILLVLREADFYDRYVLAGVLVSVVLAGVVIDIHAVMTARLTNVEVPEAKVDITD
ncbi:hypothetical protein [Litorihabitans aurantiacus]|uniref:ATP synthase protein I n=1 Tax=Litorihabitans aurantiacus TaxID=1930061 RepID=A0AA37XCW5_9MICO|nr:hypothetical protein [Litorihabitans aurantiacus]GMA30691.1 hypothetical protein GCM10025875_06830 [Litorihabitans aurantiacus]